MFLGISTFVWAIIGGTGFLTFLGIKTWKARKQKKKDNEEIKKYDKDSGY